MLLYKNASFALLNALMDGMRPKLVLTTHEQELRDPVSELWFRSTVIISLLVEREGGEYF